MGTTREGLDEVFRGQRPVLLRTLARLVGSMAVAEDLVQETYVRVAAALGERSVEHLQPFIYQTARNLAFDHLRAKRRQGEVVTRDVDGAVLAAMPSNAPTPDAQVGDRELLDRLATVLVRLPPRQRHVFVIARLEGRGYTDIAAALNVSTSTVQKDVRAAMAACIRVFRALDET